MKRLNPEGGNIVIMTMMYKCLSIILVLLIFISCSPSEKSEKPDSSGLGDVYLAAYQGYKKAEEELDKLYNQILEEYGDKSFSMSKLKETELAWTDFKDAQLDFLFPGKGEEAGAASSSTQYWLSMKELTEARISLLRIWLMESNRVGSTVEED